MFQNPYGFIGQPVNLNPYQTVQPAAPQMQVTKLNGRNGAMQYQMGPNSSAWILDESGEISWLIITDGAGYKTVTPYDVKPHQEAPAPDFGSLESRIKRLEELINGNTTDTAAAGEKQNKHITAD